MKSTGEKTGNAREAYNISSITPTDSQLHCFHHSCNINPIFNSSHLPPQIPSRHHLTLPLLLSEVLDLQPAIRTSTPSSCHIICRLPADCLCFCTGHLESHHVDLPTTSRATTNRPQRARKQPTTTAIPIPTATTRCRAQGRRLSSSSYKGIENQGPSV